MSHGLAAIPWPNGKFYLFEGATYRRWDAATGALEDSGLDTASAWHGLRTTAPDAALWYGYGKAYFFYGSEYVRYDVGNDAVDPDYLPPNPPFQLSAWGLPWSDRIDAAVNWGNGKLYFFRDGEYVRYDVTQDRPDPNYPKPIDGNWPGVWTDRVDAALYTGGPYAWFFRGNDVRRFSIAANTVDWSGTLGSLTLDPVPAGIWKAARDLTPDEGHALLGYLIANGALSLGPGYAFPTLGASTNVVVKPAAITHEYGTTTFIYANSASPQPLLDNVDQRMVVVLYRLVRWLNGGEPTVSAVRHLGIGHGQGAANDCHNQGRALDFSGVDGESQGTAFTRSVLKNWGNLPANGTPLRLDPVADPLSYELFLKAFRFGTFECECNGIGSGNSWPPKDIGDPGGYVIHPDYVDTGAQVLRPDHQNHIHMQVGKTLA